jgi:hypothetical protein
MDGAALLRKAAVTAALDGSDLITVLPRFALVSTDRDTVQAALELLDRELEHNSSDWILKRARALLAAASNTTMYLAPQSAVRI